VPSSLFPAITKLQGEKHVISVLDLKQCNRSLIESLLSTAFTITSYFVPIIASKSTDTMTYISNDLFKELTSFLFEYLLQKHDDTHKDKYIYFCKRIDDDDAISNLSFPILLNQLSCYNTTRNPLLPSFFTDCSNETIETFIDYLLLKKYAILSDDAEIIKLLPSDFFNDNNLSNKSNNKILLSAQQKLHHIDEISISKLKLQQITASLKYKIKSLEVLADECLSKSIEKIFWLLLR